MSTPSTSERLADQLALSRLDDDGAPTGAEARSPAGTPDQAFMDGGRLSMVAARTWHGGIGGGWWPRSRDATAELPALLAELSTATGRRVTRVAVQADAFGNIPRQLVAGGRKVHVAWFRHMDMNTVHLTMADHRDLVLLVIPPLTPPAAAARALRAVASGPSSGLPGAIPASAGIAADSVPMQ